MSALALYEISSQYLADLNKLNELELDEQTFLDTLEGLSGELEQKAINVAMYIKNLEVSADAIKQAEKSMADRRKAIESKNERIRKYLLENMLKTGITKIECPHFVLSVRKNPASVDVLMQDQIPDEYFDIPDPLPPTLNKKRLAEDLKAGVLIEGARLTQGNSLQIK
jgi:hypothetical protein